MSYKRKDPHGFLHADVLSRDELNQFFDFNDVSVQTPKACPECHGTGSITYGYAVEGALDRPIEESVITRPCHECDGSGILSPKPEPEPEADLDTASLDETERLFDD